MSPVEVPGGAAWSGLVRAGRRLGVTALEDGVNASLLLLSAGWSPDRLNLADTMKAQHRAGLSVPMVLMSDRGVALASLTASTVAAHDTLCGHSTDAHLSRWPATSYQADRNARRLSARTLLLSELRKHGRDRADLHACVNLFSTVTVDEQGRVALVRTGRAGDTLDLRAEVDLLVVLATAPHPLRTVWDPGAVRLEVTAAPPDDAPAAFRPESARALAAAGLVRL